MPRWLIFLNALLLVLLGAGLMYVIEAGSGLELLPSDKVSPSEFISIILTALAVILGALTLMLAALAIVGWSAFKSMVERRSEDSAKDFLKERFSDGDKDYLQFVEDIKEDVRLRLLAWSRERPNFWDAPDNGDDSEPDNDDPDA